MAVWLVMGSIGSSGRVMGALWALTGVCLSGLSGESQGGNTDEEKEETSLDCWRSARGGECSHCGAASAEEGNVTDRGNKHYKN